MIFFFVSDIEQNIMVFLKFTKRIGTKHLKMKQKNVEKSEEQRQNKNLRGPEKNGESSTFLLPYALVRTTNHIVCV